MYIYVYVYICIYIYIYIYEKRIYTSYRAHKAQKEKREGAKCPSSNHYHSSYEKIMHLTYEVLSLFS